jgi:hypothetical protein
MNAPGFNPTKGCKNEAQCDGKGGLLAYLEGKNPCAPAESAGGGGCNAGCIVGAVLGSVFGAALLGILAYLLWRQ